MVPASRVEGRDAAEHRTVPQRIEFSHEISLGNQLEGP